MKHARRDPSRADLGYELNPTAPPPWAPWGLLLRGAQLFQRILGFTWGPLTLSFLPFPAR